METGFNIETIPDYSEIEKICAEGKFPLEIPLYTVIDDTFPLPADAFKRLRRGKGFILESLEGNEKTARYSILGFDIRSGISFSGGENSSNPLDLARRLMSNPGFRDTGIPVFPGGYVGYFSYDMVYSLYPGRFGKRKDPSGFPLAEFILPGDYVVYDHYENRVYIASLLEIHKNTDIKADYDKATARIARMRDLLRGDDSGKTNSKNVFRGQIRHEYFSTTDKKCYEEMVAAAREHIYSGDIYQAVVSRKFECEYAGDPFTIYRSLRRINPSPYMYFIDFGDRQVIGASPEMLVRCRKKTISTVPIAGTRRRGTTPEEDEALADELLADAKECSEHIMLVDLARNDIGRVSKYETVRMSRFMDVEKFSHVQHIVSTVEGELKEGLDGFDAFKSCFPAGTVSGAPKIRAMEIIDELEDENRGLYAGAVGYICPDGDLDFAIAIRTILAENGKLTLQAGAGIVADSVPETEFLETENKAAGLINAINVSGVI